MSSSPRSERSKRAEYANRAVGDNSLISADIVQVEAQMKGGIEGAIRWTVIAGAACVLGHYTWPFFRRQTLAFKGFITSSATIFGLVVGADNHLLNYEDHIRRAETNIRRRAHLSLIQEGKIPSEAEIAKWRQENVPENK
ncbi:hypothetical protein BD324DRAFT_650072 [Kockovaella imperatae]|uniref:HIG1 domain-containing protein n=1 Tax=Kockovaella imperatae TaxID=4999 RepID=A0A1Y1UKZ6_9TREE|nr:hypothetical protein BD324DRAFT_650072 [Kockovaella imperatae]ORX38728.1 hypothetical protein BD324DRAFT_650072 [Kockovaella imperatae]